MAITFPSEIPNDNRIYVHVLFQNPKAGLTLPLLFLSRPQHSQLILCSGPHISPAFLVWPRMERIKPKGPLSISVTTLWYRSGNIISCLRVPRITQDGQASYLSSWLGQTWKNKSEWDADLSLKGYSVQVFVLGELIKYLFSFRTCTSGFRLGQIRCFIIVFHLLNGRILASSCQCFCHKCSHNGSPQKRRGINKRIYVGMTMVAVVADLKIGSKVTTMKIWQAGGTSLNSID